MALSEIETKRIEKKVDAYVQKRRPPPHIRPKLDIGYRVKGQSVEVFEIRPVWKNESEIMEYPVAKATFIKTRGVWKVYWMRADLNWHSYQPTPTVGGVEQFLALIEEDRYACFWG